MMNKFDSTKRDESKQKQDAEPSARPYMAGGKNPPGGGAI